MNQFVSSNYQSMPLWREKYIAQVCLWEFFLFTDNSKNNYFTKVFEVIKYFFKF